MQNIDQNNLLISGGCSAKFSPDTLKKLIDNLPILKKEDLIVGAETSDDSAVWKLTDEIAIIKTLDFFPSVCKDPYTFGKIAAANALSDVYAMGGEPFLALNIAMFPINGNMQELQQILKGGADKLIEAEVCLGGGHTINDEIPKYGLSVSGKVHPDRIIKNCSAKVGEDLILTKRIGTGTVLLSEKFGFLSDDDVKSVLKSMMQLNKECSEIMQEYEIKCATDITGFGLLGHGMEMAKGSGVSLNIFLKSIPIFDKAYYSIDKGCIPNASFRNLEAIEKDLFFGEGLSFENKMLLCDPQTSGGIFFTCPKEKTSNIVAALKKAGYEYTSRVGEITEKTANKKWITILTVSQN